MSTELHECAPENAKMFKTWIETRGGIAVWKSINLSNPGVSWSTPALTEQGEPYPKPTWQAESTPGRVIKDAAEVVVVVPREVKRFHVAVRRGGNGLQFKLTDASSRKVRSACEKAGEGAWYEFDYSMQEAVILLPDKTVPLMNFTQ